MASAEGVECPVCCELFDDQNICPRMLSCGHSFCTSCLERLLTMAMIDKIPCPTCRVEVNLPEAGVAGLPKNFALLSIANDKPRQEGGEALFICEVCDSKHPATFWCFNCKEDMCKNAARFHTRSKASRDHQLISLQSAAATECCPKHKEPFRLFDEACGHVVCRGCIQLDHKDHNCSSLAKAASKCRQEMKELATKVSARTEVIKDAELQVKQASLDMKKAYDEKNAEIQRLFKEIHAALTTKELVLLNELKKLHNSKAAILTGQQEYLNKFQESIETTAQGVLSRIRSSGDVELLVARSALESTLSDVENKFVVLEPAAKYVPELVLNRKRLLDAIETEGNVIDKSTYAENTIAHGPGLLVGNPRETAIFIIKAYDAQNCPRALGDDVFVAELKNELGEKIASADVLDRGDGTYWANFTVPEFATIGAEYMLTVRLRGAHIKGSPFTVTVTNVSWFSLLLSNKERCFYNPLSPEIPEFDMREHHIGAPVAACGMWTIQMFPFIYLHKYDKDSKSWSVQLYEWIELQLRKVLNDLQISKFTTK